MGETIFVVERHDSSYGGASNSRYTREGITRALELAREEREAHRAEDWDFHARGGRISFTPCDGSGGWVDVRRATLE
jgi:hypothetical protein